MSIYVIGYERAIQSIAGYYNVCKREEKRMDKYEMDKCSRNPSSARTISYSATSVAATFIFLFL